jgi:FRG domain
MSRLKGMTLPNTEYLVDADSSQPVLHVTDPHTLTQAAGYLKHVKAHEEQFAVFYRGQSRLYSGLVPSLFRGLKRQGTECKRVAELNKYIDNMRRNTKVLRPVPEYAHEPLLQHYGVNTTWIDLVDNIWIALWFACYKGIAAGKFNEYLHFESRNSRSSTVERYAYILGSWSRWRSWMQIKMPIPWPSNHICCSLAVITSKCG